MKSTTACAVLICTLPAFCGCASFTRAQIDLVTQARKGIATIAQASAKRQDPAGQLAAMRRQRLDQAFDDDARNQAELSPDWIIDARKAYAAALDAYDRQRAADEAALAAERSNLAAVDAALQKLQWMQSIQQRFSIFPEVNHGND
jgi:hypothetical protein